MSTTPPIPTTTHPAPKRPRRLQCPWCSAVLPSQQVARCPSCGRYMRNPFMRVARKRAPARTTPEEAAAKRPRRRTAAAPHALSWLGKRPAMVIVAAVLLLCAGSALLHQADRAARRRNAYWRDRAIRNLRTLATAIELFGDDCGRHPTHKEGLKALVLLPPAVTNWGGPYISALLPDPWGTPYRYCPTSNPIRVWSAGPDRRSGTVDDIVPIPDIVLEAGTEPRATSVVGAGHEGVRK